MFDIEKVKTFREEIKEEYNDRTILDEVVTRELFDPEKHDLEFFQAGFRTGLPMKFFTEGHLTVALSNDFARAVFVSERNHILIGLKKEAESNGIPTIDIDEFTPDEIRDAIEEVSSPTDVFIPAALSDNLHSWISNDALDFDVTATYIETESSRVRIRWVPDKHGFENIFVVDSDRVSIVQKEERYADDVGFIDGIEECKLNSPEDLLMTYFGRISDKPEEFDFFVRTVISNPITSGRSACMIDTGSKDIELVNKDD